MVGGKAIPPKQGTLTAVFTAPLSCFVTQFSLVGLHFISKVLIGLYVVAHRVKGVLDDTEGFSVCTLCRHLGKFRIKKVRLLLAVGITQIQSLIKDCRAKVNEAVEGHVPQHNRLLGCRRLTKTTVLKSGKVPKYRFLNSKTFKLRLVKISQAVEVGVFDCKCVALTINHCKLVFEPGGGQPKVIHRLYVVDDELARYYTVSDSQCLYLEGDFPGVSEQVGFQP